MDLIKQVEKTIIVGVCWLSLILLFLALNPLGLNILQNTEVVLASGVISLGTVAFTWIHNSEGE